MKRLFLFVFAFSFTFSFAPVFAQDGQLKNAYLLVEQEGEILAVEPHTGQIINFTADLNEMAVWPYWSVDEKNGEFVSFLIVDKLPFGTEIPYGIPAWVEVDSPRRTIHTVDYCQQSSVRCTDAQIGAGEWLIFTAEPSKGGIPSLYAYNISSEEQILLYKGAYKVGDRKNVWLKNEYQIFGRFTGNQDQLMVFSFPDIQGSVQSPFFRGPYHEYMGCNSERIDDKGNSLVISSKEYKELIELENAEEARGDYTWRSCTRGKLTK
jgi:hypothetical protein